MQAHKLSGFAKTRQSVLGPRPHSCKPTACPRQTLPSRGPEGLLGMGRQLWTNLTFQERASRSWHLHYIVSTPGSKTSVGHASLQSQHHWETKPDPTSLLLPTCLILCPGASARRVCGITAVHYLKIDEKTNWGASMKKVHGERKILGTEHKEEFAAGFSLKDKTQ